MNNTLIERMKATASAVEAFFADEFSFDDPDYGIITKAQRYSLLAGGKRIRPFLVFEFSKLFGGDSESALTLSGALEMIHTFSLIHDDLPCMDNDTLRRGRNTCHIEFDEATALLAGDALSIAAFELIAKSELSDSKKVRATLALSSLSGQRGMIAGQIIDLAGEKEQISYEKLIKLHSLKTGCLIRCAAILGCISADIPEDDERYKDACSYANKIGLAFQIVDDILDKVGDSSTLGKTVGKDEKSSKTTFLTYMSVENAMKEAERLTSDAIASISKYKKSEILTELAKYLLERKK